LRLDDQPSKSTHVQHIYELFLLTFDLSKEEEQSRILWSYLNMKLLAVTKDTLIELYEGFSGYFTMKECSKALELYPNHQVLKKPKNIHHLKFSGCSQLASERRREREKERANPQKKSAFVVPNIIDAMRSMSINPFTYTCIL